MKTKINQIDSLDDVLSYQTPVITGVDITINSVAGFPAKFKLDTPLTGAITVNTLPLRNPDGTDVTELEVGLYEVLADATFFTLRASGGTPEAIYGKRDGPEITLVNSKGQPVVIKQGEYTYMNETVALFLTNPIETIYDITNPVQVVNAAYDTRGI